VLAVLHGAASRLNAAVAAGTASPEAVAAFADAIRDALDLLGLGGLDAAASVELPAEIASLAAERTAARAARDWARADELRVRIEAYGFSVRDTPQGQEVVPTTAQ
jgi:cysteinyl-tRNA synthetase